MTLFTNIVRISALLTLFASPSVAEETVIASLSLPFASMEQEVTYSTSKADYDKVRDDTLARMKEGDASAFVNPSDGPWLRAETVAKIGIEVSGMGGAVGKKNVRQVTAAEAALYLYEKWKAEN